MRFKPYFNYRFVCFSLTLILGGYASLFAQELPAKEMNQLRKIEQLITETEKTLGNYPKRDFSPNLMFQLTELYVQRSNLDYQRSLFTFEEAQKQFDSGLLKIKPQEPKIDFGPAIAMAKELLKQFPKILYRDKVLYRIAVCYQEEGDKQNAVEYFKLLSVDTDDQSFLEEAYFRIGEYYFEQRDYKQSVNYYRRLLDSWDSPFFEMSLYKLAWSYYNDDNFSEAISTLLVLIDDMRMVQESDSLSRAGLHTDLIKEAEKYAAISFAEFGGPVKVKEILAEKKDKSYTRTIMEELVAVYEERDDYSKAIESLRALLEFYPKQWQAPHYLDKIVTEYERAGDKEQADNTRWEYISEYGPKSPWMQQFTNPDKKPAILEIAEKYLYALGTEAHQMAQKTKQSAAYQQAIGIYKTYLENFPKGDRNNKIMFYLAECFYDTGNYSEAANRYYDLVLKFPDSEFREKAAYHRILAYNQLFLADTSRDSVDFFLMNFPGEDTGHVKIVKVMNASQAQVLQSSNDFLVFYPHNPLRFEVAVNYAKNLYDLNDFTLAEKLYRQVAEQDTTGKFAPKALLMLGQSEFSLGHFTEVEKWMGRIYNQFPDSIQFIRKANTLMASAQYKQAEEYAASGDSQKAALAFEDIALSTADSAVAERALFEAALQYQRVGDLHKAILLFEQFPVKFPLATRRLDAYYKAATLSEEIQDWDNAAKNYLILYKIAPKSDYAKNSLFSAARCYENNKKVDFARKYYEEYTLVYTDDPDKYLEAAFKKGELSYETGHFARGLKDFQFVLAAHRKFVKENNSEVESYFPANSQYMIGEIKFDQFRKIKLSRQLKRRLKQKQAKFREVVKAYTAAAHYKVAEWTTASSFKIGQAFEEFAQAIWDSPRPKNLKEPDLKTYNAKLLQTVLPLKQKALTTYEANIKQADENSIDNYWISESRKRVQALKTELQSANVSNRNGKSTL